MKKKEGIEKIQISDFRNPSFVRILKPSQIPEACQVIRQEILQVTSQVGGHLSSNLGVVELTVALHRVFDLPKDKLIFDVGHQSYTHKILSGRDLSTLNQKDGVIGFQNRKESEFDPYDAGHSSTALSAAQAFAMSRDWNQESFEVIAVVGDASIVNGLSFEALNSIGGRKNHLIVVLNDNGMSITPSVGGLGNFFRKVSSARGYRGLKNGIRKILVSTKPGRKLFDLFASVKNWIKRKLIPFNIFDNLGFSYMGPLDGHNEKALEKAFRKAKRIPGPVVVHVHTTKGKGFEPAEKDESGYWHGVTPFHIETGEPVSEHPGFLSWSHFLADLSASFLESHPKMRIVTAGTLKGSNFESLFERFPKQCIELGISEEHALTFSGAISLAGFHPVISMYSTFLQRAYDEISHDCARMGSNMTILIERSGLVGSNGETHQGIYDEGFLSSIPGVTLTMPSNVHEAKFLYETSLGNHGVFCIRVPRELVKNEIPNPDFQLEYGEHTVINQGTSKKLLIVSVGPKSREIENLRAKENIDVTLVTPIWLNPISQSLVDFALGYENILIHDAYSTKVGFCNSFLSSLMEKGYSGKVIVRSLPNEFISALDKKEEESAFGLTAEQVLEEAKALL